MVAAQFQAFHVISYPNTYFQYESYTLTACHICTFYKSAHQSSIYSTSVLTLPKSLYDFLFLCVYNEINVHMVDRLSDTYHQVIGIICILLLLLN